MHKQHIPLYALASVIVLAVAVTAGVPAATLFALLGPLGCMLMMVVMMRGMSGQGHSGHAAPRTPPEPDEIRLDQDTG